MRAPLASAVLLLLGFSLVSAPSRSAAAPSRSAAGPAAPLNRSDRPAAGERKLPWLAFDAAAE